MRNRLLRSVLVAAFSAVVAFGTLAGLSGAKSDSTQQGGARSTQVAAVGVELPVRLDDTVWD
ncbi:hypothetical protein [Streptomyces sp. NPDC096132]|uniref:hypothetical protein n=1 Tax=Streptomyces sp. NPDC096132 TaxID=3366075 RepID=UPI003813FD74